MIRTNQSYLDIYFDSRRLETDRVGSGLDRKSTKYSTNKEDEENEVEKTMEERCVSVDLRVMDPGSYLERHVSDIILRSVKVYLTFLRFSTDKEHRKLHVIEKGQLMVLIFVEALNKRKQNVMGKDYFLCNIYQFWTTV